MLRKINKFTLTELIVALSVFLILITLVMQVFKSTQSTWDESDSERDIFESARITLDLIGKDLQCVYYGVGTASFWHHASTPNWDEYSNELIAFVSTTPNPVSPYSSDLFEIKYQLYYTTDPLEDTAGWILRSVTGNLLDIDNANPKWNFNNNFSVGFTTNDVTPVSSFTADNTSGSNYNKVVPYVTAFSFKCYNENGVEKDSDNSSQKTADSCNSTDFPYSVEINLKLLDRISWNKWVKMFPNGTFPNNEPETAENFRKRHEREFKEMVLIGNRGQY